MFIGFLKFRRYLFDLLSQLFDGDQLGVIVEDRRVGDE